MKGYLPLLIGLAIGFVLYSQWERANELDKQISILKDEKKGLDTVFVRDTIRLRSTRVLTDSILKTDTVFNVDTVRQIVYRERAACDSVLSTCELQKANLQKQLDLEKKKHPSRFGCTAGVAATAKGAGLGGSCGIRLF